MLPPRSIGAVACMDPRWNACRVLGIAEDGAHVIRDAGGVATDDGTSRSPGSADTRGRCGVDHRPISAWCEAKQSAEAHRSPDSPQGIAGVGLGS